jgi:hypothetical protein
VQPAIRTKAPGETLPRAAASGKRRATLRWTAPGDGTWRIEFSNAASTLGRIRVDTRGLHRARKAAVAAPGLLPFPAYEGGSVLASARGDGPATGLACRPPAGPDRTEPSRIAGRRARLGPLVPLETGVHSLVLGGEGGVLVDLVSKSPSKGAVLVR